MTTTSKQQPFVDYRSAPGLNHSHLSRMATSPLAFKVNADLPDSAALREGRRIHLCVLEHDLFLESVVAWPGGWTRPKSGDPRPTMNKNSADYKELKEHQEANGHEVVDQSDIEHCERIRDAVYAHQLASMLLTETDRELSIYWEHPLGIKCKSRIDALAFGHILDMKFLRDVTPRKVNRSILDYNYHCQAAYYQDAVRALTGEKRPYYIVAAEKTPPFDVVVYELDDAVLGLGRQTYLGWMQRYLECMESSVWPGISAGPVKVELPEWAYQELDDGKVYIDGRELSV